MRTAEEKTLAKAMREGFTLIEILVAVAIIGILGTVATMSITKNIEKAKATAAREAVNNIKGAVTNYYLQNKKYPSDLQALVTASGDDEPVLEGGEGALEDPWGNDYRYERSGKKVVVMSAGPDGDFGTDDDIRSDKIERSKSN